MTAVSKSVYFDVLYNIVNKYNNIVHRKIKVKPIDVKSDFHAEYNEDSNKKNKKKKKIKKNKKLNLELVIMLEFQNIKIFLLKDTLQIGQKTLFLLVKLEIQFCGLMLLVT